MILIVIIVVSMPDLSSTNLGKFKFEVKSQSLIVPKCLIRLQV
jgi:hypothetical protein